jgi:hypothetical protein
VLGRVFIVERGTVHFDTGDATNPHLDVSATWRSQSGVLVRATITGTAREPHLEWGSEPPLPGGQADVVALVLGSGGSSANGGGAAVAAVGALANEALAQTGVRGVEIYAAEEGTSDGQVARLSDTRRTTYTAAVQVSEELWFEGSYGTERTGPEADPRAGFSGTLDWRFAPDWSARTEVGQLGVGLDLLWQYRY